MKGSDKWERVCNTTKRKRNDKERGFDKSFGGFFLDAELVDGSSR